MNTIPKVVVCPNKTSHIVKEMNEAGTFTTLCENEREGKVEKQNVNKVSCSVCVRKWGEEYAPRNFVKIAAVINPNGQELKISYHWEREETKEEHCLSHDLGPAYVYKVKKAALGEILDESSMGGWLNVLMWLKEPTPEELEAAKSKVLRSMGVKVKKHVDDAQKLANQYTVILKEQTSTL